MPKIANTALPILAELTLNPIHDLNQELTLIYMFLFNHFHPLTLLLYHIRK